MTCSYCNKEIKNPKFNIDNEYFCNSTHLKKYCYEKIKSGNLEDKYISPLIDEKLNFKNSNFKIENKYKTQILCYLYKKENKIPKCLYCGKDLCKKYFEENKFYNPFINKNKFCSNKCYHKYNKKDNKTKKEIFLEAYENKNLEPLLDSKGRINSNAMKVLQEEYKVSLQGLYKHFYNVDNKCKICGKPTKFINFKKGFQTYCSKDCMYKDKELKNKIQMKIKESNIKKYGVSNHTQKNMTHLENLNEDFVRKNFIKNGYFLNREFMEYYSCTFQCATNYKAKFGITEPVKQIWNKENEIYKFIKENYEGIIHKNKRGIIPNFELDIYLPELNFAIEYDGLFFHSQGKSNFLPNIDKNYHLQKTELCEEKDIHLFHIFSNEWLDLVKQDIWKSKILLKLKSNKIKKYNARDGIIKEINPKQAREFLNIHHLQGYIDSKIKLGFFINDELLAVMTFGKSRFKSNEFEIIRFASKKYTTIRGLFGKFLKYFEKKYIKKLNIRKLISYGNRRWTFKHNVYEKFMELEGKTSPNFFYFKDEYKLYNRMKFQKHNLEKILNNYNKNLSTQENIFNEYRKIFDCGNFKYNKKY